MRERNHNLIYARRSRGLTQQALADLVGVERQSISEYERGAINPSVAVAMKLGKVLEIDWTLLYENLEIE